MATYNLAFPDVAIDAILTTAYHLQQVGYIFRGSASDYSGTPSEREWVIAPAGFSGLGLSSAVPQGSFGICLYNGTAWVGKVINVLTLDSAPTRNSQNGVTSGGVAATLDEIAGGIMETFASLLFDDETAAGDLSTKLSYAVKFSVSDVYQTVTHLNILAATTSKAGLMSAEDKAKVDSFLTNLRSLTFSDTTASADQGTQITETLKATIGGVQEVIDSITLLAATSSKAGLLSASDKAYIDALPATLTTLSNSISGALALMQSLVGYYVCDTAAATAAKTVAATGYSLTNGGCIRIKMTNANTAANVTLNINSTGAKALYYDGAQASATNTWEAGEVLEVYYDGTQYQCASGGGGGKFATGQKVADTSISSEFANNDALLRGVDAYPELYDRVADGTISVASTYTFTTAKYINTSGEEQSGAGSWRMTTNFIPIGANWLSVTIGATAGTISGLAVAFYSSNSESSFISGSPCTVQTTVQIPANARYVRFCKANGDDVHTINLYAWQSKITILDNKIDDVKTELESEYVQIQQEVDFLPTLISGKAYKSNGIGTVIASSNYASFKYAKIACKKGDIFAINGFGGNSNAWPCIVTDANDIVLFGQTSQYLTGGVYQVTQDSAAWLYVSVYNATPSVLKKLAVSADGTLVIPPEYANVGCMATTGSTGIYNGVVGFGIPLALRPGDVVKIKFNSFNNYRGYLLKDENMAFIGYISDSSLNADTLFSWNGSGIAYLYVNGNNSWWKPQVTRYARETVAAMKNYRKRMVALGDSITSYDASDIGELVRGHIGMAFCRTATQIDWGNIAEGLATICNWSDTTEDFTHSGANHNRTLPNEVLKLLQHTTAEGAQITWHINSNNTDYSIDTTVATGTGYTADKPDLIYISMGTNDSVTTDDFSEVIAQSYGALTKLTICSSLRWCLETLQNVYPDATIVCVIPIKRGTRTVAEQEAKNELIRKMCNYMAIPVVDGYTISGYSPLSYGIYSTDQIHPNNHTQRIARSIAAQVDALI